MQCIRFSLKKKRQGREVEEQKEVAGGDRKSVSQEENESSQRSDAVDVDLLSADALIEACISFFFVRV